MSKYEFLSVSVIEFVITFAIFSVVTWYLYYLYCFTYWKRKGVPAIKPQFPTGNILKSVLGQESILVSVQKYYNELKSKGHRHGGLYFFNGPVYLPVDPEIIKSILSTDFEHFTDRGVFIDEKNLPLSGNMFSYKGLRWKNFRTKISPSFSSGKLKAMYEIFQKMTDNFVSAIEREAQNKGEVNIKHVAANFTADIIFSTAFGLESETLKYPEGKLSRSVLNIFNPPKWLFWKAFILEGFRSPGNFFRTVFDNKPVIDFFTNMVKHTVSQRDEHKIIRKDFLSLLLEIRDKEGLTLDEIAAQCFLFILAGFETSSQTISCCIHSLARNQEFQEKLRKEIYNNLGKDFKNYTYEDINRLPYLDKVFNETLRLYPALAFFNRICIKPYTVPGTDVVIEEGTPVLIPVSGLQLDPEYFPDPLKFDPERFSEDQTQVPFTFLPFGDGPRICIGMRYGKLQTKLGIAALISQFRFSPHPNSEKIEVDKLSKTVVMIPPRGITVKVAKIDNEVID